MTDLELLSQRVAQMESRFRWTTRTVVATAVIIMAAAVMAQDLPPRRPQGDILPGVPLQTEPLSKPVIEAEVRSHHFVLVDEKGKERASLVTDRAGSVFLV